MKKTSVKLTALVLALVLSLALALTGCGSKSTSLKIAVPNDTTNEARALLLLQENGIIELGTAPASPPPRTTSWRTPITWRSWRPRPPVCPIC